VPLLQEAGAGHLWPESIRSRAYDRFEPNRETHQIRIVPLTVEISAGTVIVVGTI